MLADRGFAVSSGQLAKTLHLPGAWLDTLIDFIFVQLPVWRDDPRRSQVSGESTLTDQLCAYLNSACELSEGFDALQFRQEVPDAGPDGRRKVDLAASPRAAVIWVAGRPYGLYDTLFPIECKRLPIPPSREKREYLHTVLKTTGGVQRFKHGWHGSSSDLGLMIAYIQNETIGTWFARIDWWVRSLARAKLPLWSEADRATMDVHDTTARTAAMTSVNARSASLTPIRLRHLWVEM